MIYFRLWSSPSSALQFNDWWNDQDSFGARQWNNPFERMRQRWKDETRKRERETRKREKRNALGTAFLRDRWSRGAPSAPKVSKKVLWVFDMESEKRRNNKKTETIFQTNNLASKTSLSFQNNTTRYISQKTHIPLSDNYYTIYNYTI